jgi:hypothetical protein
MRPIDPRLHREMNGLARALDEWFNGSLRGKEAEANQLRAEIASSRGSWPYACRPTRPRGP